MKPEANTMKRILIPCLLLLCGCATVDPIDKLVAKLDQSGLFRNGFCNPISLPATASPEEVLAEAVKHTPFNEGPLTTYHVIKTRKVPLADGQQTDYTATLIDSNIGKQVCLMGWQNYSGGWWWTRFYPVEDFAATNRIKKMTIDPRYLKMTLPSIELTNASLEQAIKLVQHEWNRLMTDESRFVIEVDVPVDQPKKLLSEPLSQDNTITLKTKDIPVIDLLKLLSDWSQCTLMISHVTIHEQRKIIPPLTHQRESSMTKKNNTGSLSLQPIKWME
jgi:hypothetical protein